MVGVPRFRVNRFSVACGGEKGNRSSRDFVNGDSTEKAGFTLEKGLTRPR